MSDLAPHFLGKTGQQPGAESSRSLPAAEAPAVADAAEVS